MQIALNIGYKVFKKIVIWMHAFQQRQKKKWKTSIQVQSFLLMLITRQWSQNTCTFTRGPFKGKRAIPITMEIRSSWPNCALRDDEAVYWVSIGHCEAAAVGNWWYWVSRDIHAFIYCKKWRFGRVSRMPDRLTDWQLWKIVLLSSLESIRVELS